MFFQKKKYKEMDQSIKNVKDIVKRYINMNLKGVPLSFVLSLLSNDMLVDIHIQPYSFINLERSKILKRLTVADAREILTREEKNMRVADIKEDYDYGYNKNRPVAVVEIPAEKYWLNRRK